MSMIKPIHHLEIMARRKDKIRDILFGSKAVHTTEYVKRLEELSFTGRIESYLVPTPDNFVTIYYDIFADDLVKNGYGNVRDFSKEVIDMLMLFCDDDDQISIKKCELEVNMRSILEGFVPTFPEGVPVCKELRSEEETKND